MSDVVGPSSVEKGRSRRVYVIATVLLAVAILAIPAVWEITHLPRGVRSLILPAPTATHPIITGVALPQPNVIQQENLLPGTTNWYVPPNKRASNQIQAYLSATSVQPGRILSFYVSTQQEGTAYSIDIYRLGWYGGAGGRLLTSVQQKGHAQGYYDQIRGRLFGCSTCQVDTRLGLVEANWRASYRLTVPTKWVTGVYLAKFTDDHGIATFASFVVAGNSHSPYVIVTSDTTVAAYNEWGGYSLYLWRGPGNGGHARKVSFDRPVSGWGDQQGLIYEINGIRWAERQGYDLSYMSSTDLHEYPQDLLGHRAYVTFGHDEYWSKQMRDGVEKARDAGVGLGFMGANIAYWQIRFEPDSRGISDRTVVCYKEAANDPLFGIDNAHVTTQWRLSPVNRPENALMGVMYAGYATQPNGYPWQMGYNAQSTLLNGADLKPGQRYGCDLVGYEWDRLFDNARTPVGFRVLSTSSALDHTGIPHISQTGYYVAPSGALVFAAGTVDWTYALDDFRLYENPKCAGQPEVTPGIQTLTANVMSALVIRQQP